MLNRRPPPGVTERTWESLQKSRRFRGGQEVNIFMKKCVDPPVSVETQKHLLTLIQIRKGKKGTYLLHRAYQQHYRLCCSSGIFSQFILLIERNYKNNLHRVKRS